MIDPQELVTVQFQLQSIISPLHLHHVQYAAITQIWPTFVCINLISMVKRSSSKSSCLRQIFTMPRSQEDRISNPSENELLCLTFIFLSQPNFQHCNEVPVRPFKDICFNNVPANAITLWKTKSKVASVLNILVANILSKAISKPKVNKSTSCIHSPIMRFLL